jgi:hypothetical protein
MKTEREMREALGSEVLVALVAGRSHASSMLGELKRLLPAHVRTLRDGSLAAIVHDYYFDGISEAIAKVPHAVAERRKTLGDYLVVKDIFVIRVKKHDHLGRVQAYETQAAKDFHSGSVRLDGLDLVALTAGYLFDDDLRELGSAVLSYRTGVRSVPEWCYELDEEAVSSGIGFKPIVIPPAPLIETYPVRREATGTSEER